MPTFIPRTFLRDVTPYTGEAWVTLSKRFCEYVVTDPSVARFRQFYRYALVPEEMFFQTVIMHSPFAATLVPDFRRYIPKYPGKSSPRILRVEDYDAMLASGYMFARKFDSEVDAQVIDMLYERSKCKPK